MSDEFFNPIEEEALGIPKELKQQLEKEYKPDNLAILEKLFVANTDINPEHIIKGFEQTLEEEKNPIPIKKLRENWVLATAGAKIRSIKTTKPFRFYVTGAMYQSFSADKFTGKVYGFILDEKNNGDSVDIIKAPTALLRQSAKESDITNFFKGMKRLHTYSIMLGVVGERKIDFDAEYRSPNFFKANDVTDFSTMVSAPPKNLTISTAFKELYGLEPKTAIENEFLPKQTCGVSGKQKGSNYIDEYDFKMLIITPTSDPNATRNPNKASFSATSLGDPEETISVFCHNDPELVDFSRGRDAVIAIGTVEKKPSSYSEYTMNMVAMEPISFLALDKLLGGV